MIDRRVALALVAGASFAVSSIGRAEAAAPAPFEQAAFEAALRGGRSILIHVETSWCPICRAQRPILERLRAEPRFKDLVSFDIDFDEQKEAARSVGARHQSTLIVYKGGREVGRLVGESQPEWIEDLLEQAL